jgi:hypothetical protein
MLNAFIEQSAAADTYDLLLPSIAPKRSISVQAASADGMSCAP